MTRAQEDQMIEVFERLVAQMGGTKPSVPPIQTVTYTADTTAVTERLTSISQLLKRISNLIEGPLDIPEFPLEAARIHSNHHAAPGTSEVRVRFEPTDALLEFETALLARYRQLLVIQFTHESSVSTPFKPEVNP